MRSQTLDGFQTWFQPSNKRPLSEPLIFAACHLEPLRTSLLIVIALPIGIARLITRRLTASVVAHVINNFLPGLTLLLVSVGVMPA